MSFKQYCHDRIRRNDNDMMRFDNTINFEINKRARYESRHIIIVNNEFTSLQIRRHFFRVYNINVNQYFDSKLFITYTFFLI